MLENVSLLFALMFGVKLTAKKKDRICGATCAGFDNGTGAEMIKYVMQIFRCRLPDTVCRIAIAKLTNFLAFVLTAQAESNVGGINSER